MEKYVILTDVTCDMSEELRTHFGVKDYVHGYIHFSDNRDFKTELNWNTISRKEFYDQLSNKHMKISTAPASPEEYYNIFLSYAKDGYAVLSMSISSKISSTFEVAKKAAARVKEELPESNIYCFNSMRMSGAFGLLTAYAHLLQAEGKTMQEVIDWLEANKQRVHQMGPIDDLMFVARRGRISTGKAIMGSFAGVKPMGDCNNDGYVTVLTKAKGIKKALSLTVAYIAETAEHIEDQFVFIMHSNREAYAEQLRELVESRLHPKQIFVSDVFCASGTNIGPGMIGVYFLGAPISEDGSLEKECMNRAIEKER